MENKVKEVEEKFNSLRDKRKQAEEERIITIKRIEEVERKFLTLQRELEAVKAGRQKALADGDDHVVFTKKLKDLEDDIALLNEERIALKSKIENLMQLDASLGNQISTEKVEVARVRIVELAGQYNKFASALAPIIKQIARCRDDLYGADHVVWTDWDCEIFQKVPRISFEPNDYGYFFHRDRDGV